MSSNPENIKLSHLIRAATQEMAANTKAFVQTVSDKPVGNDTVTMMVNGTTIVLNRDDYMAMKAQNEPIKQRMKDAVRNLTKRGPVE